MAKHKRESSYFLANDRFFDYLKETEMVKEIYNSKEGIISIVLSTLVSFYVVNFTATFPQVNMTNHLINILNIILGGGFGLLGFLVGGMAIIVGSIGENMLKIIDKAGKFPSLLAIVFRFYFDGFVIGMMIIISVFNYLILILPLEFNRIFLFILTFLNAYLFFYSLILSVMLLGTSIRLMILEHALNKS